MRDTFIYRENWIDYFATALGKHLFIGKSGSTILCYCFKHSFCQKKLRILDIPKTNNKKQALLRLLGYILKLPKETKVNSLKTEMETTKQSPGFVAL